MRVLMVSEDLPHLSMGGLGKHAMTLACALERAGHKVDILGNGDVRSDEMRDEYGFAGEFFGHIRGHQIGGKEKQLGIFNPLKRPLIAWRIAQAIMRYAPGYDVIHYHGHSPDVANLIPEHVNFVQTRHDQGSDCLRHTRFRNHDICTETSPVACALCATPNPNFVQVMISARVVRQYRMRVVDALRRHKTIFVSDMLRRNLCRTAGDGHWGSVIHNFIDYSRLRQLAANHPHKSDKVEVLIAGKLWEPKGVEALLAEVANRVPDGMRIRIAGDGTNQGQLHETYSRDQIVLMGWQSYEETIGLMSIADIVVVPSICEESCATTVLEGLALGKPVLALNRGGTPELATYQRHPGQLRMFETLLELTDTLVTIREKTEAIDYPDFKGDVTCALPAILCLYRFNSVNVL